MLAAILLCLAAGAQDLPPALVSISGTATDFMTATPLAKVQVIAEPTAGASARTITDEKGDFVLIDLKPGEYRLRGVRNGYLDSYYGAVRADAEGITLTLAPDGDIKDLRLKMFPYAVVAGTVRDPDGEPITGARVSLIAVTWRNGIRRVRATGDHAITDDRGQYRMPNVRPGSYYLRAGLDRSDDYTKAVEHSPKDRKIEILVPTFHPAARDLGAARKIEVRLGERFTGADVTLLPSRLYHVRVEWEPPPGVDSGIGLHPRPDVGDGLGPNPASNCHPGVCEFLNVPSGSYFAVASTSLPNMTVEQLFSNSAQTWSRVPIDVVNADVTGFRVVVPAPAEVAGHVVSAGDDRTSFQSMYVQFIDDEGGEHTARVAADGAFTARLSQGRYEVNIYTGGGDLVPKFVRSEDTDVLREGLVVSRPGKLPLEIALAHDGAALEGIVRSAEDQTASGVTVVLVPESGLRSRHDLYRSTNTDQFGRYHFNDVSPGSYKLFVWAGVDPDVWFDPDFLKDFEDRGQLITVDPKAHSSKDLRLLSASN